MHFEVDLTAASPTVRLADVDNFRAFQVEASGPRERIGEALAGVGRWDGEYAWFTPDRVRELAGERGDEADWQEGFARLQEFAAAHGYTGEDGTLRAHVEWREVQNG